MGNIILNTDSYKLTHYRMYPPHTNYVGSYFESRGGEFDKIVFFGLQHMMEKSLSGKRVTQKIIDEADDLCQWHFNQNLFNREGWEHILDEYNGVLPISICAVPEGSIVDGSNVLFTVENTDPNVPWLTNHVETMLVQLWYPCTIATIGLYLKKLLNEYIEKTSDDKEIVKYMLHDFGFRGSTSMQSAALGGAAHLINFLGTDNIAGMKLLMSYYDAYSPGFSVPAAEHSTIISWGEDNETDAYRNILEKYPAGIVSVVSDSYDIEAACDKIWGGKLKKMIEDNPNRRVVIRPDSGDPSTMIIKCLDILSGKFGYELNSKKYKVLPSYLRIIYGDGITRKSLPNILANIESAGYSVENLVFGSGGGLLQDCNRDTLKFALKCSWVDIDGKIRNVSKHPKSDLGKASKAGKLKLVMKDGKYETVNRSAAGEDIMKEVFRDGEILVSHTLHEIRKRMEQ